jgi:hypothetical protein
VQECIDRYIDDGYIAGDIVTVYLQEYNAVKVHEIFPSGVLETMQEIAYEDLGECTQKWEFTKEQEDSFQTALEKAACKWLRDNDKLPSFLRPVGPTGEEEYRITEDGYELVEDFLTLGYDYKRIKRLQADGQTFFHKREVWSKAECERACKARRVNSYGDAAPEGLINDIADMYPSPGHLLQVPYNTGERSYKQQYRPLPVIPEGYGFDELPSWGTRIIKL